MTDTGSRSGHSLALDQEKDGKVGFNRIIEGDDEQITQARP